MNNSAVKDSHVAEDRKLGNMLKRGREKVKEVAEKGRSVRARVKVKWRQWLRLGRLWDWKTVKEVMIVGKGREMNQGVEQEE